MAFLLLLLLLICVTGVRADTSLTALIITSCIAGIMFLALSIGGVVFCIVRGRKISLKKKSFLPNDFQQPATSSAFRPKAYTQHPPTARPRPPITFYTLRADPRDLGFSTRGTIPMTNPGYMMGAPSGGRPVLYLDAFDMDRPVGNATNLQTDTNGLLIREIDSNIDMSSVEDRYSRRKMKTKEKSKSRNRSRSKSRDQPEAHHHRRPNKSKNSDRSRSKGSSRSSSDESTSDEHHSSQKSNRFQKEDDELTPILSMPGDVILRDSMLHPTPERQQFSYKMADSSRPSATMSLQERDYTMTFEEEEEEPESTSIMKYFLPSSRREEDKQDTRTSDDLGISSHNTLNPGFPKPGQIPKEDYMSITSHEESTRNQDPMPQIMTPREDYHLQFDSNAQESSLLFSSVPNDSNHHGRIKSEDGDSHFDKIHRSVDLTTDVVRPPTPPFDGFESPSSSAYPSRVPSKRQIESSTYRPPTPPLDIPSTFIDDVNTALTSLHADQQLAPTSRNTERNTEQPSQEALHAERPGLLQAGPTPVYAFMTELKRRQRYPNDEDDVVPQLPTPPRSPSIDKGHNLEHNDNGHNREQDEDTPSGQIADRARVSFATTPPQIIPRDSMSGSTTFMPPDYDIDIQVSPPPAPPPPPPPPPPPSQQTELKTRL